MLILIKALYLSEQMIVESLLLNRITHPKGEHGYSKILHMMVKDGSTAFLKLCFCFSLTAHWTRLAGVLYYVCICSTPLLLPIGALCII